MLPLQISQTKTFISSLLASGLAVTSIALGVVPNLTQPTRIFDSAAHAQQVSETEVRSYARAVMSMEPLRQNTYNEIKRIVSSVPNIACNQPRTFAGLPGNARQIAQNYCRRSHQIVQANGLSIERFNQITAQVRRDEGLGRRIQQALIDLQ